MARGDSFGRGCAGCAVGAAEDHVGDADDEVDALVLTGAEWVPDECAAVCVTGAAADSGSLKSSVTHTMPFLSMLTPTPTCVKSWSRMLARCSGLFMKATWMSPTVGPSPTFSPTACQLWTAVVRLGLWYSDWRDAMAADCDRATAVRS